MPSRGEEHQYFVYILTNATRVLYVGVTNDLYRRVWQHREGTGSQFASHYHLSWLVYYESHPDVLDAIDREKQIKRWRREKKIWLIELMNPKWRDLAEEWFA